MRGVEESAGALTNGAIVATGASPEDYIKQDRRRGDPEYVMSRSELCTFAECPAKWINDVRDDGNESTEFGTLMDLLITDKESFDKRVAVTPTMYPCEPSKKDPRTEKPWIGSAKYCQDWEAERDGKLIVSPKKLVEANTAVNRLMSHKEASALIKCSDTQVLATAEYDDEATGLVIPIKCLIDLAPKAASPFRKSLADYKTSRDASERAWVKQVFERGYHVQAAMYLDAYVAATGEDRIEFRHIIQENFAPWQVEARLLSDDYLQIGRVTYKAALKFYCQCLKADHWPGYKATRELAGWGVTEAEAWMIQ